MDAGLLENIKKTIYHWLARKIVAPYHDAGEIEFQNKIKLEGFYSQCGQDKWVLDELFKREGAGFFADIGAHDGRTFSNTLALEEKGWKGIAFEPNPNVFKKLAANRTCECINACVNKKAGPVAFILVEGYSEMLSGMVDTYQDKHMERLNREIEEHNGDVKIIQVEGVNFASEMLKRGVNRIDYLSIDVEGGELNVLKSIDFKKVDIRVVGVENNYRDWRIPAVMLKNGYRFHSIAGDEFFVKKGV
jgi:FkbM family methyltransferase